MIRGTTEIFTFKLPCKKGELEWAKAKFWQPYNPMKPITKTLLDCSEPDESSDFCVSLTAEETQRFSDKYKGMVQFRAKSRYNDVVFASFKEEFTVYPMYDGLLEDED